MVNRKNAFKFFSLGMGALAGAGAVATSLLASTYCPALNTSTNTLIDPIAKGPIDVEGSLAMNATVFGTIKADISSSDLKLKILLKMQEKFINLLTSMPESAETTCKVGIGIVGSLLTMDLVLTVIAVGYVGKQVYDFAHHPEESAKHKSDIEGGYMALAGPQ